MPTALADLFEYREFLLQYTLQSLRARYRTSVLGFLWTLLNPVLVCLSLSLVFSYINRADLRTFGLYFFGGYIPWTFFVGATSNGTFSIVGNTHYVTRIYLPKVIFPVWATLVVTVDLLAGLVVVVVLAAIMRGPMTPALLVLPLSALILFVFCVGLSFLFGAINVFLRDFQFIWASIAFLWFFFSPIMFPIENIPARIRPYFYLNPIIPFLDLFQYPISKGILPPPTAFLYSSGLALAAMAVGVLFFVRSQKSFYIFL
jgi:ABC-type polysaccharide/polyol phosphate export permease